MKIHPSAIIGKEVELAPDVSVGPFAVISGRVKINSGTKIEGHCQIGHPSGIVEIGVNNHLLFKCDGWRLPKMYRIKVSLLNW